MKNTPFKDFLEERPAINVAAFAREMDFDPVNLKKIAAGLRPIPRTRRGDFLRLVQKYGYTGEKI